MPETDPKTLSRADANRIMKKAQQALLIDGAELYILDKILKAAEVGVNNTDVTVAEIDDIMNYKDDFPEYKKTWKALLEIVTRLEQRGFTVVVDLLHGCEIGWE